MNERLTTRNLAELLAIRTEMEKERAEKFIESLSSYITQRIEKNKSVKILGLGIFKIVLVRERASVHIHTGERFVIPAHHKLSFIPDKNLKEQINRPFAFFEPIEATEEIYSLSLKKQHTGDPQERDPEDETDTYRQETSEPTEIFTEDEFLYSDDSPEDHYIPEATEKQPIVALDEEMIPEPDDLSAETEAFRYLSEDQPQDIPFIPDEDEEDTALPDTEDNDNYHTDEDEEEILKNYYESENKPKKATTKVVAPLWLWFLLLPFLIVAGVGIATYAFLYYNTHTPDNPVPTTDNISTTLTDRYDPADAEATTPLPIGAEPASDMERADLAPSDEEPFTAVTDSVQTDRVESKVKKRDIDWFAPLPEETKPKQTDRPASATTSNKTAQKQTGQKNTPAGKSQNTPAEKTIPARVRMTAGSSLTQIAMEHYGDKVFWVYIYDYNKSRIKDFNNIPVGMELRLPQPNVYSINAKSKTSLQKARQKQSELLKWDKWDDYQ